MKYPDLNGVPSLIIPACAICRCCNDAQFSATRHEFSKIVDILNVVENNEPVGGGRRIHTGEEPTNNGLGSGLVTRLNF